MANAGQQRAGRRSRSDEENSGRASGKPPGRGVIGGLGDSNRPRPFSRIGAAETNGHGGSALANGEGRDTDRSTSGREQSDRVLKRGSWDMFDVVHCTDGKARRFEPGSFPLAHGLSHRVGLLRGYGNAIVPAVAQVFIESFLEIENQ